MKNLIKTAFAAIVLTTFIFACSRVPLTGRKQLMLVSPTEMMTMSFTQYKQFLDTSKVVPMSATEGAMVNRVGTRIQKGVEAYLTQQNQMNVVDGFKWEYHLVQNKQVNAWCMPGGKVVVYSGILPITQTEEGLAVVLGHEISHAIAQHGAERMSESLLAQGVMAAGETAIGVYSKNPQAVGQLFNLAVGAGATLGLLAHSRNQESEADHLGLIFMSMAGYNPQHAIAFWNRMTNGKTQQSKVEAWLSDHPTDQKRIEDLTRELPEAMQYYQTYGQGTQNTPASPTKEAPYIRVTPKQK